MTNVTLKEMLKSREREKLRERGEGVRERGETGTSNVQFIINEIKYIE